LFQYYDRVHESRVSESLRYIQRYQNSSENVFGARLYLDLFWVSEDGRKALDRAKIEEWPRLAKGIAKKQDQHMKSVYTLLLFYREVSLCAREGLCDKRTTCTFFRRDINAFKNLYRELFQEWGESWAESFTVELECFANETCK